MPTSIAAGWNIWVTSTSSRKSPRPAEAVPRGVVGGRKRDEQHEGGGAAGDLQADLQVGAEAGLPDAGEVGKCPVPRQVIAIQQLGRSAAAR